MANETRGKPPLQYHEKTGPAGGEECAAGVGDEDYALLLEVAIAGED